MSEDYEEFKKKHAKELNVTIDPKPMQELMERNKELNAMLQDALGEKDDYKAKLRIVGEQMLNDKKKALGAPDSISSPRELMEWEKEHANEDDSGTEDNVGHGSAGSVSLSDNQQIKPKKVFNSQKEMIDHLTEREAQGDKEAGQILDKLTEKWMKSAQRQHDGQHLVLADAEKAYENEGIISVMQEREREKIKVKKNARK